MLIWWSHTLENSKVLWDDLVDFEPCINYYCGGDSCDVMVKYKKQCEKIRVHQFLMSLDNARIGTSRSNLLSHETVLNLDEIYSQIAQKE